MTADIQLIATDLDGTFLRDDKTFDEVLFKSVLQKLKIKNIPFVITTGVHQERINVLLAHFLDSGLAFVNNNGARVLTSAGEVIYERTISAAILRQVQQLLIDFPVKPDRGLVYSTDDTAYVPRQYSGTMTAYKARFFQHIKIFDDVSEIKAPILKVTMNWEHFNETKFYEAAKLTLDHAIHVTETGTGAIDIVPATVNKAVGLKKLADHLGIDMANVAAFGDGGNDLEMLSSVGHPYVMPNATLQGDFNHIEIDNNHAGVLKTILDII
ncbi:Cof-type HAD-IIB family hydrolase [Leuconostoc carnosum]|uniref:Cof-type HAD-IIB family hydrolase n=1 Tax=Leuconostoc carnosum TaxID=1252 RepID=UPI00345DB0F8